MDVRLLYYYRIPQVLENDSVYRDMKDAAGKPERARSLAAYWYLTARALEQWDSPSFLNTCLERQQLFFTTRYNGQLNWSIFGGMEKKTALEFLSRIGDENVFTQSENQRRFEAESYDALGETASALRALASVDSQRVQKLKKATRVEPCTGSIEGRLLINGNPAEGVQLRLVSASNFPYFTAGTRILSEDEYLHNLTRTFGGETLFYDNYNASSLARKLVTVGMRDHYLPLITTRTDSKGAFRFSNLARGQYYLVARFPQKLTSAVPKKPLGIIELREGEMSRDIGTLELQINKQEAAHE